MQTKKNQYKDKTILVTGGVGSIGKELIKKLIDFDPRAIRVLDNNETGLFDLLQEVQSDKIRPFIGDIRDKERLQRALEGADLVFHAAALKHVPLCEYNPFEAVMTNIIGTQNVLSAALEQNVRKVVLISTDKAVNPTNVMGATKLLSERLTISANYYRGSNNTVFTCVRFGNVLNSRGSVVPLFKKQIESGGPVTITDTEMTRFIMELSKSVALILKAAEISQGGEIFILKMPAIRIKELAEAMIEILAPRYGYRTEDISITITGKRPGEKLYEELLTPYESPYTYENDEMFMILPHCMTDEQTAAFQLPPACQSPIQWVKADKQHFSSNNVSLLTKDEIKELISHELLTAHAYTP